MDREWRIDLGLQLTQRTHTSCSTNDGWVISRQYSANAMRRVGVRAHLALRGQSAGAFVRATHLAIASRAQLAASGGQHRGG